MYSSGVGSLRETNVLRGAGDLILKKGYLIIEIRNTELSSSDINVSVVEEHYE